MIERVQRMEKERAQEQKFIEDANATPIEFDEVIEPKQVMEREINFGQV